MLHISPVAVDYIFERFSKAAITGASRDISKSMLKINKAMSHRPVNPNTTEFKKFLEQTLVLINRMSEQFPIVNLNAERNYFEQELEKL